MAEKLSDIITQLVADRFNLAPGSKYLVDEFLIMLSDNREALLEWQLQTGMMTRPTTQMFGHEYKASFYPAVDSPGSVDRAKMTIDGDALPLYLFNDKNAL